ncbi:DNA-directed RNA polymerase 7 kDa subunit, partial [Monkeypox virus]
LDIN